MLLELTPIWRRQRVSTHSGKHLHTRARAHAMCVFMSMRRAVMDANRDLLTHTRMRVRSQVRLYLEGFSHKYLRRDKYRLPEDGGGGRLTGPLSGTYR